jgi:hypothetical protein
MYYRLLARPLFEGEHTQSRLLRRVQSMAIVVWLTAQLDRINQKALPYISKLYDKAVLYEGTLKVGLNFLQIVGSFARYERTLGRTHARDPTHRRTYAHMHAHARPH